MVLAIVVFVAAVDAAAAVAAAADKNVAFAVEVARFDVSEVA